MSACRLSGDLPSPPEQEGTHTPFITNINGEDVLFFSAYQNRKYVMFMQRPALPAAKIIVAGKSMCAPWVIPYRNGYRMYATVLAANGNYEIWTFLQSPDPEVIPWSCEHKLKIPIAPNATSPCVIKMEDGSYTMFFTVTDDAISQLEGKLYKAKSDDGVTFRGYEEISLPQGGLTGSGFFKPNILFIDGRWVMFISELSSEKRWYATIYESGDLESWRFIKHIVSPDPRYQFYKPVVYEDCMAIVRKNPNGHTVIQFSDLDPNLLHRE